MLVWLNNKCQWGASPLVFETGRRVTEMRNRIKSVLIGAALAAAPMAVAQAQYAGPALPAGASAALATYCSAANGVIAPNYQNAEVATAAKKLSKVSKNSYYFYNPILSAYGLGTFEMGKYGAISKLLKSPVAGVTNEANAFLVQLCGEFRDRPSMIQAKLRWVANIFTLPNQPQGAIDYTKNVWSQLSAKGYGPYIRFTDSLWTAKKAAAGAAFNVGGYGVDAPVMPNTVCETKVIVNEYVAKGVSFPGLAPFNAAVAAAVTARKCVQADLDYYYDFRGDSNFKPQSPESNGMLWYGNGLAGNCASQVKSADPKVRDADCQAYFARPFASRWNGARAGLASWVMRSNKYDSVYADTKQQVYVSTSNAVMGPKNKPVLVLNMTPWATPFSFMFDGDKVPRVEWQPGANYAAGDLGISTMAVPAVGGVKFVYERLRDAVNRHTDWYKSGWTGGLSRMNRQAYSPFVASSYEMSKSDAFTAPGYTVGSTGDGRKHWMFVFRVHKSQWYTSKNAQAGTPVNFDFHWFDETSLGTASLAKQERAFDRLGTALENELDSILYLHNLDKAGSVVGNE